MRHMCRVNMNIVLCGMMGCGKSTVAAELCELTGMEHADTDAEIVKAHGRIADIFQTFGEPRFREIEREVTAKVASRDGLVISTGGGCVLDPVNVRSLKANGRIVFLRTSAAELVRRLKGDSERPLLAGGVEKRVNELLPLRTPAYLSAADVVVDTDGLSPKDVAKKVAALCGAGIKK